MSKKDLLCTFSQKNAQVTHNATTTHRYHPKITNNDHTPSPSFHTISPFKRTREVFSMIVKKLSGSKHSTSRCNGECCLSSCADNKHKPSNTSSHSWKSHPRHIDKPLRLSCSEESVHCCSCKHPNQNSSRRSSHQSRDKSKRQFISNNDNKQSSHSKQIEVHAESEATSTTISALSSETIKTTLLQDVIVSPYDRGYGHASAPFSQNTDDEDDCNDFADFDIQPSNSKNSSHNNFRFTNQNKVAKIQLRPLPKIQPHYDKVKDDSKSSSRAVTNEWNLTKELLQLSRYGWYWGPISRLEAEDKLRGHADGTFLVRDSSDDHHLLSLSFRSHNVTLHTRIEHCDGVFSFYAQHESEGRSSIVELIESSVADSQGGVFCYSRARQPGSPSFPVRLVKPLSRLANVKSLQYLCRFVIRQNTRKDLIQKLPLPFSVKLWLEERQY